MQKRLISLGLALSVAVSAATVPAYAAEVQRSAPEGMFYQIESTKTEDPMYEQRNPEVRQEMYSSGKEEIYTPQGANYSFVYQENESSEKTGVRITGCKGSIPRDLVLPTEINGKPVTVLAWNALQNAKDIVSLTIPSHMTEINENFYLWKLENFYVAEGNPAYKAQDGILYSKDMKTIVRCPCAKKGTLKIPDSVTSIGDLAYMYCDFITGIPTFPAGLKAIGSFAFKGCEGLHGQVVLPNGLETLENGAFYDCPNLVGTVTIPAATTTVGDGIFSRCPSVTAIWAEEGNRYYTSVEGVLYTKDYSSLICCPAGKSGQLNLPEGLRRIGEDAFAYCTELEGSLKLPESLESIGYGAFYRSGISGHIHIPAKLKKMADSAFEGCDITSFSVSPDNPSYSDWGGLLYDKTGYKLVCYPYGLGGNLVVPDGTTEILARAINPNGTYRELYLPKSLTYIDSFSILNSDCDKILYAGSKEQWDQITIKTGNSALDPTKMYYNQAKPGPCTWRQDSNGSWWYDFGDGEYAVDDTYIIDGNTFLFDENGYMQTGWQKDNWECWAYFNEYGHMLTGWQQLDGNWYYFQDDGMMAAGNTLISGSVYPFSTGGIWDGTVKQPVEEGWQQSGDGRWWYQLQNGDYAVGPIPIGNDVYCFDQDGYTSTGWILYTAQLPQALADYFGQDSFECWLYADASGRLLDGWQQIEGNWYYLWEYIMLSNMNAIIDYAYQNFNASGVWTGTGASVQDGWVEDEKGWRYVEDGIMDVGENPIDGQWHRFGYVNGYMKPGWVKFPDRWTYYWRYYEPSAARLVTGDQVIDGVLYHFDDEGYLEKSYPAKVRTGWQSDATGWWYNDADGNFVTGWQYIDGAWYYFSGNGYMQTGWQYIDGAWYYFNGSGYMQTGWQWIDGSCYYFNSSGAMAADTWIDGSYVNGSGVWVENAAMSGWQSDATGWWYNDANGDFVTGWQYIDGAWYYFNGSGYMQTGWQWIDENWYYFYGSGAMAANTTIDGYTVNGSGVMV